MKESFTECMHQSRRHYFSGNKQYFLNVYLSFLENSQEIALQLSNKAFFGDTKNSFVFEASICFLVIFCRLSFSGSEKN